MKIDLSPEARAVGAAWFGMMRHADSESQLRFGMVQSRPTAKAQAGLDELVAKGWISRENEKRGAVIYRPLKDCTILLRPLMKATLEGTLKSAMNFALTEPIAPTPEPVREGGAEER